MKNATLLITIIMFLCQPVYGQIESPAPLKQGWERIHIKNVGYFDLPSTMEVQKGKYKKFNDEINKIRGFDATQLTAQPKSLNEFRKTGFEKYARVMIETVYGSFGDFEKLNFNISEYTQSDISEINTIYKQQLQQSFLGTGLKLIEWYPLKFGKINGMSYINISYKRQLQDKPFVLVHIYYFHNKTSNKTGTPKANILHQNRKLPTSFLRLIA